MKKYAILVFVISLLSISFLFGNDNSNNEITSIENYSISNIPEELLKDANAVVRIDETEFILESPKKATMRAKYVITILNKKAARYAHFVRGYDKQRKISNIKVIVYDAFGKEIKKYKKKEIVDQSAISDISLYEDNRIKAVEVIQNRYPFTVEMEYELEYNGLLVYPSWHIYPSYNIAVQQSSYVATIPRSLGVRYKANNIDIEPKISKNDENDIYKWEINNYPTVEKENYGPSSNRIFPSVILAPNKFEYDGHPGSMENYTEYGKWMYGLLQKRDQLPEETKMEVKKLVSAAKDDKEKVQLIYEYLQSKTRYISIQLGIGGLQPFEAEYVDKNGYGDCKALSNYTKAMLQSVNIPSYYATIGAGEDHQSIQPEFAWKGYTNHAILCVPLEKDTIWLECTSQSKPYGFMGSFTGDRNAMLVTEKGGVIVRTPSYPQEVNTQIRNANIEIDALGNATAKIKTDYGGLQYENVQYQFINNDKEKKETLFRRLDISNMEINSFEYSQNKAPIPVATENLDLTIRNYGSVNGQRVFVPLNILNKIKRSPKKDENRKNDVVIRMPYVDVDSIVYEVPPFFKIEHLPKEKKIESDFGSYHASVTADENTIIYVRTMKRNKGTFPPESYSDLIDFYKKIIKADKMKMVFVKENRP